MNGQMDLQALLFSSLLLISLLIQASCLKCTIFIIDYMSLKSRKNLRLISIFKKVKISIIAVSATAKRDKFL